MRRARLRRQLVNGGLNFLTNDKRAEVDMMGYNKLQGGFSILDLTGAQEHYGNS